MNNYTNSHKRENIGHEYDSDLYATGTQEYRVGLLEKHLLEEILGKLNAEKVKVLDFACGTGRISSYLEDLKFKNIIGADVSEEMLKNAKRKLKRTVLCLLDINENITNKRLLEGFDVITAFRFFLNAEHDLKNRALHVLHPFLNQDGILIFNIHKNTGGLWAFFVVLKNWIKKIEMKILRKTPHFFTYFKMMSNDEIIAMLDRHNFKVMKVYSYSYLPSIVRKILPLKYWLIFEKRLTRLGGLSGSHLLYICKRMKDNEK